MSGCRNLIFYAVRGQPRDQHKGFCRLEAILYKEVHKIAVSVLFC